MNYTHRNYLGASVCALITIWPAVVWNMPFLVIVGGLLGWFVVHVAGVYQTLRSSERKEQRTGRTIGIIITRHVVVNRYRTWLQHIFKPVLDFVHWVHGTEEKGPRTPLLLNNPFSSVANFFEGSEVRVVVLHICACCVYAGVLVWGTTYIWPMPVNVLNSLYPIFGILGIGFLAVPVVVILVRGESKESVLRRYGVHPFSFMVRELVKLLWIQVWWIPCFSVCVCWALIGSCILIITGLLELLVVVVLRCVSCIPLDFRVKTSEGFLTVCVGIVVGSIVFYFLRSE